jgi:hypothetical protein
MARALDLTHLTRQPDAARDPDWERALFQALQDGKVHLPQPEPRTGADGWPYIYVETTPQAKEPVVRILEWLTTRGIGLVLNGNKDAPDYIFTYGMIWNWKERGEFLSSMAPVETGLVEIKAGQSVLAGPPSAQYLPAYVRQILKQFLKGQGVEDPKILVLSNDQKHFDLCFSLESLGSPPSHEHRGIAEALSWFMPHHYSLMLISESGLPSFVNLN